MNILFWLLIAAQLPAQPMPQDTYGWPAPAFKQALAWEALGVDPLAQYLADDLWAKRDPATGLWLNWLMKDKDGNPIPDADTVNPMYAVLLYARLGQPERAETVYQSQVAQARKAEEWRAHNLYWWPLMSATILSEPWPADLRTKSEGAFEGHYSPLEEPTDHGRYYADQMKAWWQYLGGPKVTLHQTSYCEPENQPKSRAIMWRICDAQYHWAAGETWLPLLETPYGFLSADVVALAAFQYREVKE